MPEWLLRELLYSRAQATRRNRIVCSGRLYLAAAPAVFSSNMDFLTYVHILHACMPVRVIGLIRSGKKWRERELVCGCK